MTLRLKTILVTLGVLFLILLTLGSGFFLFLISGDFALSNPELAYMRFPVLLMAWAVLVCAIVAMVLGLLLLRSIFQEKVFELQSVRRLQGMGLCAFAAILPLAALYIYTLRNVPGSITNLWVMVGIVGLIVGGVFFFLVATLFEKVVQYKQENDLTV